ncbi:11822_t:CDS:1 [Funneliformis geosporum]|nr:11822_t:CDS:1 [Funneliformis geosporum]
MGLNEDAVKILVRGDQDQLRKVSTNRQVEQAHINFVNVLKNDTRTKLAILKDVFRTNSRMVDLTDNALELIESAETHQEIEKLYEDHL